MIEAKILRKQGYKQAQIAEMIGISERTVRTYLKSKPSERKKPVRGSCLDSFVAVINNAVQENPYLNCALLFEKLKSLGYIGQISILRDKVAQIRKKVVAQAVIRFETVPGLQAQVDWGEFGKIVHHGYSHKLYAFVMTLGYSRKSYVRFVLSMKQSVLHDCHRRAFEYFAGVTHEVLYDNMKTAFICNSQGTWIPNRKLLGMAHHFGFIPKRCMVRRPQTKGKVERFIGYLRDNFWPGVYKETLELDTLNEKVMVWLKAIDEKPVSGLGESRNKRFENEINHLKSVPLSPYDSRDLETCSVHTDSHIRFESNMYSVPPHLLGEQVHLKVDYSNRTAEVFTKENESIRTFNLEPKGKRIIQTFPQDHRLIMELWEKQKRRRLEKEQLSKSVMDKYKSSERVKTVSPSIYDSFYGEAA